MQLERSDLTRPVARTPQLCFRTGLLVYMSHYWQDVNL